MADDRVIPVNDHDRYTHAMEKSMMDKLYFMDKVDAVSFFDYGCADGALLHAAQGLFPDHAYFGFDEDLRMVERCKHRATVRLEEFQKWVSEAEGPRCLILSSVVHELYSYRREWVPRFWKWAFEGGVSNVAGRNPRDWGFDYIALRDMCVSRTTSRPSDPISVAKVRMRYDRERLSQWEARWGSLDENWSLTHFLLTYRYTEGWEREVRENYLPIPLEELLSLVPEQWEPRYIEHFTLPYVRGCVRRDFGIDLQDRTHLKLILARTGRSE